MIGSCLRLFTEDSAKLGKNVFTIGKKGANKTDISTIDVSKSDTQAFVIDIAAVFTIADNKVY